MAHSKQVILIVTGATGKLGRSFCHALVKTFVEKADYVHLIVNATNDDSLQEFAKELGTTYNISSLPKKVYVHCVVTDWSKPAQYVPTWLRIETVLNDIITTVPFCYSSSSSSSMFSTHYRMILINNHGTLGPTMTFRHFSTTKNTTSVTDKKSDNADALLASMLDHSHLNTTSFTFLNAQVLGWCSVWLPPTTSSVFLVNISSLGAIHSLATLSLYCQSKAARNMLLQTIAEEEKMWSSNSTCAVKTLNYAPGPCDTAMAESIQAITDETNPQKVLYASLAADKKLIQPEQTAKALAYILNTNTFESGQHLDYYSVLDELGSQ